MQLELTASVAEILGSMDDLSRRGQLQAELGRWCGDKDQPWQLQCCALQQLQQLQQLWETVPGAACAVCPAACRVHTVDWCMPLLPSCCLGHALCRPLTW